MLQVSVAVGGRQYDVACPEGQEPHLQELAAHLDTKVQKLMTATRQAADQRLLIMAALLVADELFDQRKGGRADSATGDAAANAAQLEEQAAAALDTYAQRIENLAARLQEA